MKLVKMLKIAALSCVSLIGMSQAASAEPISIAIVTALGIASGTTLFAAAVAVTNFALGLAVNFGLSLLAGALAKKPKMQGGTQTQVQYSADAYRIIPFGTVATAGREVYWKGVGKKNKTNCYVIQLADWQCHQLRAVWVNGARKTLTPVAVVGTEAARYEVQSFGSKFIVKWFPGTTAQTADSELITMSADTAGGSIGEWTSDHIGKGVCYVSFIIEYDEELMPARPQLLWEIDGALLYDWRKDTTNGGSGAHRWDDPTTWEFSSNPAVCDYNWCRGFWRNGMLLAGIGAASYDLLHSAYTTAANICDETLDDGGGSRKRYVVSVIINADGEHRIAREAFIAAMAGDGIERGGQFAVLAGAAYSPVMTLTDDDMAAAHSFKFQQKSPLSEIYNAVHVTWLNLDQPWSSHTLTPLTDAQYEDQDGGQRIARDIDLAMVPNPYQARAIGKVVLEQSRMQAIHTGVYGGKTAVLEPGDWVTRQLNRDTGFGVSSFLDTDPYGFDASALTDSYLNRMGIDELTMKVVSKRRAGPELYELTLRQCAVANFTAPIGPIPPAGPPAITPPVYKPATPGTPALAETVSFNADGAAVSTVTATWTASEDAASYVISIKEGTADWVDRRLGNVLIYSFRGRTGVTYQARVRAIDNSDLLSLWSGTASILVTGDTTAPAAPSGLSAAGMLGRIVLSWTNPGDGDLAGTEIWEAATDNFASASLIHTTAAPDQMWVRDNLGNAVTRYYWIKARDRTGNVSARYPAGGGVSGTTTKLDGGDVDTSPPSIPTGLAITSAASITPDGTTIVKMTASWNKVADSDLGYYEIGLLESGGNEVIFQVGASGSATERFEWPSVKPNTLYTLRIRASDIFSNKSAFSSTVNHTTAKDAVAPATPTGLAATASFKSIWLTWGANTETDIAGYEVYRHTASTPAPSAGSTPTFPLTGATSMVDNIGSGGAQRWYWIRAVDLSGNKSAWTASVNATTASIDPGDLGSTAPSVPATPSLASSTVIAPDGTSVTKITVTLTAASGAVAYELGVTEGAGAEVFYLTGDLKFDFPARPGVLYSVRAKSVNSIGNKSAWSSAATNTPAGDTTAPATPTGLTANPGFKSVWLNWAANSETDLKEYEIYTLGAATPAPTGGTVATYKSASTTMLVDGLTAGVARWYWVRAVDNSGNKSAWSALATATPVNITGVDITGILASNFAAGLAPVEIMASLPNSGNFEGRQVYLTTDDKIYRHTGSPSDAAGFTKAADGADITANSITAGRFQAGAIATTDLAARSVIASKLAVTDLTNLIQDPLFDDANYWGSTAGWSFQTNPTGPGDDFDAATALGAATVLKTPTGNGTLSQSATALALASGQRGSVEGGKVYRLSAKGYVTAGFTGRLRLQATWYAADNVTGLGTSNIFGIDYTSSAAGAATSEVLEEQVTAPANAVFLRFRFYIGWSSTLNNAGTGYFAFPFVNRAASGKLIVDGSIEALHLSTGELITNTAQIKDAIITNAKIGDLQVQGAKIANATIGTAKIDEIDATKITISGATKLSDWRKGGDVTKIDGGQISANTVAANVVTIGLRNIATEGLEFEHNSPSANSVAWSTGTIRYTNDAGTLVTAAISAGNAAWTTGVLYVYWVQGATTLSSTTAAATAFGSNNVVLAVYKGNTDLVTDYGRTIIDGSKIKTGTVEAAAIKTGTITTDRLVVGDFTNQADNWDFNQETLGWTLGTDWLHLKSDSAGCVYPPYRLQRTASASPSVASQNRLIPVVPGDNWFAEVFVRKNGGSGGGNIQAEMLDGTGAVVRTVSGNVVTGTSWTTSSLNLTVGATEVALRLGIYAANTTGFFNADGIRLIRMAGSALIADAAIINAKIANAAIDTAKIGDLQVTGAKIADATIDTAKISNLDATKITISGATKLSDWRKGGDETRIDGGNISANTIQANAVTIGLRGLTIEGLEFAHNSPSSNRVSWTAGTIRYTDNSGTLVTAAISGSDVAWSTGVLYVYWVQGATTLSTTTNAATAHGANNVVLAAYQGGTNLVANYGRTIIDGSKITTGTIDAAQIKANAVTSEKITAGSITASKLLIADFTNSVINSDFGGNTADGWLNGSGGATLIVVTPRGGASEPLMSAPTDYVASVGSGTIATQAGVFKMPCKGGEEYYVEVMVAGASGSTKTAWLVAHWYTLASGSSTQINITSSTFVPGTTWSTLSGTLTIPAGATAVSIGVRHNNAAGPIYFTKLRVIRRASADLVVDGAITAVKMNVTSLSAINANMGTLTAGKILGSAGFEIDATNERITSSNFVDGKAGFRLDGVSGSVKAYSGEFAGGTSSKLPFEAKFGLIQDGVLSDEGLASVRLPTALTGSADISLSGTAKRTPTGFEYNITAERVSSSAKSYIQGSFSRAKGITCPPAVCYTDTDAATVYFAYINSLGEIYTARMAHGAVGYDGAPSNVTLVGNLINSIDSDPMFEGVYANTVVHIWKSVLIKGIRRIRVPATVTVSGVPTAVVKARVWMWGAAGQANKAVRGGPGGYVKFDHAVDPGEILSLLVGGYDGDGFGGCSSVAGVTSAPDVLDGQGGGGSFLWRGPTLRANLLGVAGGGGGGPGDARNTGLKIGGPGGSTAFGGGNGVSGSAMDVCVGKSTQSGAPKGSGGGGYTGGGNFTGVGYPGKGGTNFIIGTATSTTNSASAEDGSGYSTTTTPPGTGESVYTANQTYTWGRANVGVATTAQAKAGPGMIAIQWLTS